MVGAVDVLDVVEAFGGHAVDRVVRQAAEEARQRQADIARVFRFAEGLPLGVFDGVEHLGQVARLAQFAEAVDAEQFGRGASDERCMAAAATCDICSRKYMSSGWRRELEVADQRAERRAAEGAEFFFVDLLEQRALVEFHGRLEVLHQFALGWH